MGLFPSRVVKNPAVDAADTWLVQDNTPPALRRLVSESRAGVIRALADREFDQS